MKSLHFVHLPIMYGINLLQTWKLLHFAYFTTCFAFLFLIKTNSEVYKSSDNILNLNIFKELVKDWLFLIENYLVIICVKISLSKLVFCRWNWSQEKNKLKLKLYSGAQGWKLNWFFLFLWLLENCWYFTRYLPHPF